MCVHRFPRILLFVIATTLLLPTSVAGQQTRPTQTELVQTQAGGRDWLTYGGALNNQRYSTLNQINAGNVGQLRGAWMARFPSAMGSKYKFEADPIVVDGVMYIPTGNSDIFAVDAKTGRKRWDWYSDIPQDMSTVCCGWNHRGVAVAEGMVFASILDGGMVALDQQTGQVVWRTQLERWQDGYTITGATRYFDGLVITGMSGAEYGVRGRVHALDARTGAEVWRFYTTPGPGEPNFGTWEGDSWARGGSTVWQAPAIDPQLGMLYFSTGNCSPDADGSARGGDNLYCASIVALDYRTGQYRWHFQEVHHDIWDYDAPSPVVLFDQTYNGVQRQGLYQAGKTGWLYFLDRRTGEPLIGIEERAVKQEPRNKTAATQPYPVGDAFVSQCAEPIEGFINGCIFEPYWDIMVNVQPGWSGGSNWAPTAYNPQTGLVYVSGIVRNSSMAVRGQDYEPGRQWIGGVVSVPGSSVRKTFTAMDSRTNRIVWSKEGVGDANYGALTTAGGLVFTGQTDGNVVAYDASNGNELWTFQVGWGITAPPTTFEVDGTQYVAVPAGGNYRYAPTPTVDGGALWVFSLNGTIDQNVAAPTPGSKITFTGPVLAIGQDIIRDPTRPAIRIFDGSVEIFDYLYEPQRARVPVGTTVTWVNRGGLMHTATEQNGAWDTEDIAPNGGSRAMTFNGSGIFTYFCKPHPWMIAQLTVE